MQYQIWLNGEYVARDEARIPMTDRGFRLGDVVFDTSRTFDGAVFKLRDHLDRLYRSLKYVRIEPDLSIDEMERADAGSRRAQRAAAPRTERRLHDYADSNRRRRQAGRLRTERLHLDRPAWRSALGARLRRRRARGHPQDARLPVRKPRSEGQALQPPQLRTRRNGSRRRRSRRHPHPLGHGRQDQRRRGRQLLRRNRRNAPDAARQLHPSRRIAHDRNGDSRYARHPPP